MPYNFSLLQFLGTAFSLSTREVRKAAGVPDIEMPGTDAVEDLSKTVNNLGEAFGKLFDGILQLITPHWISHQKSSYRTVKIPAVYEDRQFPLPADERASLEAKIDSLRTQLIIESNPLFRQAMEAAEQELHQRLTDGRTIRVMTAPETTRQILVSKEEDFFQSLQHTLTNNAKFIMSVPLFNMLLVALTIKFGAPIAYEFAKELMRQIPDESVIHVRKRSSR